MGQEESSLAEEVWEVRETKLRQQMGYSNGINGKTSKVVAVATRKEMQPEGLRMLLVCC